MRCFLEANTTQIVDMPRAMRCTCDDSASNNGTLQMVTVSGDILGKFRRELLAEVETISIADCEALNLSARVGDEARSAFDTDRGVELTIENVTSVDLSLRTKDTVLNALNLVNVSDARIAFRDNDDDAEDPSIAGEFSPEEIYLYALIGVSALCLVVAVALIVVSVCLCFANSNSKTRRKKGGNGGCCSSCCIPLRSGKTVSRAASWRYESNIYVNPNERQIRRPNATTTSTPGATSMALQQMMPYHLVPQREAMLVQQQQQQQQSEAGMGLPTRMTPRQQRREMGAFSEEEDEVDGATRTMDSHKYTDTSLQYADDEGGDDNDADSGEDDRAGNENESNANSSAYGSNNRASTLPISN